VVEGVKLRDNTRLLYKCNGHLAFWASLLIMGHGYPHFNESGQFEKFGSFNLSWIYDNYIQLATASMIVSVTIAVYVYLASFAKGTLLALGGNSGYKVYDFFIGRGLNPRFGFWKDFDIKEFCELKPGLIGWVVINLGMAAKQYELTGTLSLSMIAINVFQGVYVWDALLNEQAILTTMDITTDGFGYMLAFGDLSWVPFTYSLQARYLVEHDPNQSMEEVFAILGLCVLGAAIFRGANSEKDAFRRYVALMPIFGFVLEDAVESHT
jgi:delta14-sterol reductase/lamin-B receptor